MTPEETALIAFFGAGGEDQEGRTLDGMLKWGDERLESLHNYIQWMFPNRARSQSNANAPVLTDAVVAEFRSREDLRTALGRAADRFEAFLQLDQEKPSWMVSTNHNHLRITRVLRALNELGLEPRARAFYDKVLAVCARNPNVIPKSTAQLWMDAMTVAKFSWVPKHAPAEGYRIVLDVPSTAKVAVTTPEVEGAVIMNFEKGACVGKGITRLLEVPEFALLPRPEEPAQPEKPVRLSLEVSPQLNAKLEELATKMNTTKSEVLRKAIALMAFAVEAKEQGLKVGIAYPNQMLKREVVGL